MKQAFKYKFQKRATWGIAIDIVAEYEPLPSGLAKAFKINDRVSMVIDTQRPLAPKEILFLKLGLGMVADAVAMAKSISGPVLIRILQIDYNPTDYQPEGLACAIAGWASQAFNFPQPVIGVEFNKVKRRYVFSFETQEDVAPVIQATDASMFRKIVAEKLQQAHSLLLANDFSAAAEKASTGVRYAFISLLRHMSDIPTAKTAGLTDFETCKALFLKSKGKDRMPPEVGRHLSRIGTWHADLRIDPVAPNSRHEVEEYVSSADKIVQWANREAEHEQVK